MEPLFSRTYNGPALIPGMPDELAMFKDFACREALDHESGHVSAADMVTAPWQKVLSLGGWRGI